MNAFRELLRRLDDLSHPWTMMVTVNDPRTRLRTNPWQDRIISELRYLGEIAIAGGIPGVSAELASELAVAVEHEAHGLLARIDEFGALTRDDALRAEARLARFSTAARSVRLHCVSHAHIDMNWLWGFHETVSVTIDTFRTMLDLMDEHPSFTFSQSQGSTYRIIEEHAPDLIPRIARRVHEGRWELAASTWVENDKNMSGSESMVRHIVRTREYLGRLFNVDPDSIRLDFEPDTFGHSAHLPEILNAGGVEYYYHCRGNDREVIYNWESPSSARLLVFRDPIWYNNAAHPTLSAHVPSLCSRHGLRDMLWVYGVGDHGGGPTRRDLARIDDMRTWPLFPSLEYGTYHGFFGAIESDRDHLPVVRHELNFVLTGCLTSSSRIKMANRYGEGALYEAELAATLASIATGAPYSAGRFDPLWERVLFNQFHDILPGCGMVYTREYALGRFQEVLAAANTITRTSLAALASRIAVPDDDAMTDTPEDAIAPTSPVSVETGFGAGVGVASERRDGDVGLSFSARHPQVGRSTGSTRHFHLINTSAYDRKEAVTVMLWDYSAEVERISVCDSAGEELAFSVVGRGLNQYWGHYYTELLVDASIPRFGYETITVSQSRDPQASTVRYSRSDPRVNEYDEYVLENDLLRAEFDPQTLDLVRLVDKARDRTVLDAPGDAGGRFNYIRENGRGSSAWVVGEYLSVNACEREVCDRSVKRDDVRQTIRFTLRIAASRLDVTIGLDSHVAHVVYRVRATWNEIGDEAATPQLNYSLPLPSARLLYDVPGGIVERAPMPEDVGALSFGLSLTDPGHGADGYGVFMANESKYGYRATAERFALTLLRSSRNPDTHPETGTHFFDFAIGFGDVQTAIRTGQSMNRSIVVVNHSDRSAVDHGPELPARGSFFGVDRDGVLVTSVNMAGGAVVVRLLELVGRVDPVTVTLPATVESARLVDLSGRRPDARIASGDLEPPAVNGATVTFTPAPFGTHTLQCTLGGFSWKT